MGPVQELDLLKILGDRTPWLRRINWWPCLIAPAAVGALVVAYLAGIDTDAVQVYLDEQAPIILTAATLIYALRALLTRNELYLILTVLCLGFLCRESRETHPLNWQDWAHNGIFVVLALLAAWALAWRRRLARPLRDFRHTSWLIATLWAYLVAFGLYKRAFQFVPGEPLLHNYLEEGVETAAHMMLVLTASLGSLRRYPRATAK